MEPSSRDGESFARRALAHALLCFNALTLWPYFFLLSRTTVTGRPREVRPNTLFVSNHQSSLDSHLIALTALFPGCLVRPGLMPWNLVAAEHFAKTPLRAWLSTRMRCIPVGTGDGALALRRLLRSMDGGVAVFFPEGRRSVDGAIGLVRPGVGLVARAARPRVVPVAIEGTREAVRFDRFGLRFFRRIRIAFGETIDFADPSSLDGSDQAIADGIMERVGRLHAGLLTARER